MSVRLNYLDDVQCVLFNFVWLYSSLKLLVASAKLTGFGHGASPISGDPNGSRSTVSDHTLPLTDPSGGMSEDHEHEAQNNAPQIIGMSATLSDVDGLRRWFGGAFFETEFR